MLVNNYQNHVLSANEIVDYANIIRSAYNVVAIQQEPFIGLRVLCKDTRAFSLGNPGDRLRMLDQACQMLRGSGCILRESKASVMSDGIWVVTMPVPRSQLSIQLDNLMRVLQTLETHPNLGIIPIGVFEICVSGKCGTLETEGRLSRLSIPQKYQHMMISPMNSPYKFGVCTRINEYYMMYRTMWNMASDPSAQNMYDGLRDNIESLSLRISIIFA